MRPVGYTPPGRCRRAMLMVVEAVTGVLLGVIAVNR
jgi:hypothetical protein